MRYKCYGFVAIERDANEEVMTREQQQRDERQVVYETDSMEEVTVLMREGGFIRESDGKWVVVNAWADTTAAPIRAPLEK